MDYKNDDNDTPVYGLTVLSEMPISHITIKYRDLGIHYSEDLLVQ